MPQNVDATKKILKNSCLKYATLVALKLDGYNYEESFGYFINN
jgi:hypothetical protein